MHVGHGDPTESLLHLAEIGPKYCDPVLRSLDFVLDLSEPRVWNNYATGDALMRWSKVASCSVQEIVGDLLPRGLIRQEHRLVTLLMQPSLVRVAISDLPFVLESVASSNSVRELDLAIQESHNHGEIFRTLSKLNLRKLKIDCTRCLGNRNMDPTECILFNPVYISDSQNALARSCPRVRSLGVSCEVITCGMATDFLFVSGLNALEELSIASGFLPQAAISRLSRIPSVFLGFHENTFPLCFDLGWSLSAVDTGGMFLNPMQLERLRGFPRLKSIRCAIPEEAQHLLPGVVSALPGLRTLHVSLEQGQDSDEGFLCYVGGDTEDPQIYPAARKGVMLRTVHAANQVTDLGLTRMRIGLDELREILQLAGSRLERFEFSILGQTEAAPLRIAGVLLLMSICCRSVRHTTYDDCRLISSRRDSDMDLVRTTLRRLRLSVPTVKAWNIDRLARNQVRQLHMAM